MNNQYNFGHIENSSDSNFFLKIELMIYTHIWESYDFLYSLERLACLCASKIYSYKKIKLERRYKFINNIKEIFKEKKLKMYDWIEKSYHSQLRNAFAHSQYRFSLNEGSIILENYKKNPHANIRELSYDEWTERFLISSLIQLCFYTKFRAEIEDFFEDKKEYKVKMDLGGDIENTIISYDKETEKFTGRKVKD